MLKMECIECGELPKYKCPICRQPYCSADCCKQHKEKPCKPPSPQIKPDEETQIEYEFPTDDTVPIEKLKLLENSKELKEALSNPHVREIIELLDKSANPDMLMKEYMQEPIFTEFVDACLNIVQEKENESY